MCVAGVQLDSFFCGTSYPVSTPPCRAGEKTESRGSRTEALFAILIGGGIRSSRRPWASLCFLLLPVSTTPSKEVRKLRSWFRKKPKKTKSYPPI